MAANQNREAALVSIGLPVYNGSATLAKALDSLVAQDWPNIELIISDDCSSDGTIVVAEAYAAKHEFVRLFRNDTNLGSHRNMAKTLAQAHGSYFVYASQDDTWEPTFVSRLVCELEADPQAVAAMCATRQVGPKGEEVSTDRIPEPDWPQAMNPLRAALSIITGRGRAARNVPNHHFIHGVVRTAVYRDLVRAFPGIWIADRQLVCQMPLAGRLVYVDEVLFMRQKVRTPFERRHPNDPLTQKLGRTRWYTLEYLRGLLLSVLRSRIIPLHRKPLVTIVASVFLWDAVVRRWGVRFRDAIAGYLPGPIRTILYRVRWRPKYSSERLRHK